jgi:fatty acid synthase subunit beta
VDPQSTHARAALLLNVFKYFTSAYLATTDIHSLASTFDTDTRRIVLSAYFLAVTALRAQNLDASIPKQPGSALLAAASSKKASIFALFGGQGTNEVYFDELQNLYEIYKPFVAPFIQTLTEEVLVPLVSEEEACNCYTFGLDVASWLSGATARPAVPYLASVPVSFPLIGLTQLVQYLVVCHVADLTPGELRSRISGATGHSQGIVSAVVISASGTFEEFAKNSQKAVKWLFYSGLRGQQAFPVVSVEPSIVQDAIAGGEGTPNPMLSVAGLTLKELQPHVSQTNQHLPAISQLHVSLHNGPKTFVVTGPSKALFGLVTSLRKVSRSGPRAGLTRARHRSLNESPSSQLGF